MKYIFPAIAILLICFLGCSKELVNIPDLSIQIVEDIQQGNVKRIKNSFLSDEYVSQLENFENVLSSYKNQIENLEIDNKENIVIEEKMALFSNPLLPSDSVILISVYVSLDVNMPSPVPGSIMMLQFIEINNEYQLTGLDLLSTRTPEAANIISQIDELKINKQEIKEVFLMYEGGYRNPMIFKHIGLNQNKLGEYENKLDSLLELISRSKITKIQRENDTRRFVGDPELGIITLDLENEYSWTLFSLISEEMGKKESFYGTLELRHYKYLNNAVSFWIESEDNETLKKLMLDLCHAGENVRTEPKKPLKLEFNSE